jgi:hypothetical protein
LAGGSNEPGREVQVKPRLVLVVAVAVGALLVGCDRGAATSGAHPTSTANPRLAGLSERPLPTGSAMGFAGAIAAGWATAIPPATAPGASIEFSSVDYSASVFDPGVSTGFTAFLTLHRTIVVTPTSAAIIETTNQGPPTFATPTDKALWTADNRPDLGQAPAGGQRFTFPDGQFSFLPQGSTLTYQQAAALPGEPDRLAAAVLDHLRPYAGAHPPASLELKQLAYLIATAPLSNAARSAAWQAVAALSGLRFCGTQPNAQTDVRVLCIQSPTDTTEITVAASTGAIVTIADRLLRPSPLYPHVAAGTVVTASTFTSFRRSP